MFSIEFLASQAELKNDELSQRISTLKVPRSEEFVAHAPDGSEAGFLSIEPFEHRSLLFIQTVFVLHKYRGRGLGTEFVLFAETHARERGFHVIWLRPISLDTEVDDDELIDWYLRLGYEWDESKDHMEKVIEGVDTD